MSIYTKLLGYFELTVHMNDTLKVSAKIPKSFQTKMPFIVFITGKNITASMLTIEYALTGI